MNIFENGTGFNFTDPRDMLRYINPASLIANETAAGTTTASTAAGFFTEADRRGVSDDTNWTANTYKTILSIPSGRGLVAIMGGPTGLAGTPTTTFEITVDGVLTEVAIVATTTGQRALLGTFAEDPAMFTVENYAMRGPGFMSADKTTSGVDTGMTATMQSWQTIFMFGSPCLRYNTSLLIRMKSSESNSTTTNRERSSFVQYLSQV